MTFCSCRKKGLIRKIKLTSKFMTSQPSLQKVAIHMLPKSHKVKATRQQNLVN